MISIIYPPVDKVNEKIVCEHRKGTVWYQVSKHSRYLKYVSKKNDVNAEHE